MLTFTQVKGDWRIVTGERITTPTDVWDEPGVHGTVRVTPVFAGGYIGDDVTYSVQPLTLPVRMGVLFDEQGDPEVRLATAVDGEPVAWRAEPRLRYRRHDLMMPRFEFAADDAIDGVIWLSDYPPPPADVPALIPA